MGKPEEEAVRVQHLRHLRGFDAEQICAALAHDAGALPITQQVSHSPHYLWQDEFLPLELLVAVISSFPGRQAGTGHRSRGWTPGR